MRSLWMGLGGRVCSGAFESRAGRLVCYLAGVAIVPMARLALVRNAGNRVEFVLGMGLAVLVGLLCVMLGLVCGEAAAAAKVPVRTRWPEFACYIVSIGLLVLGIFSLERFAMTPAQIVLALLVYCALSLGVVVLGMLTTLLRSVHGTSGRS
jgi:4-amino-4-deoxy-L-arabinose transferase-like glycosyltransferase